MSDAEPDASSKTCPACALLIGVFAAGALAKVGCPECGDSFQGERAKLVFELERKYQAFAGHLCQTPCVSGETPYNSAMLSAGR